MNIVVYGLLIGLCFYVIETVNACPTSGTITWPGSSSNISCNTLLFSVNGLVRTIVWDNAQNSTLLYNISSDRVNGETVNTYTGIISSGPFTGQSFTALFILTTLDITACASVSGLTSVSGAGTGILDLNLLNLFTTSNTLTFTDGLTNTEKPTLVGGSITITFTFPLLVDCD